MERRCQQRGSEGGNDGCWGASSATFSVFAWHCRPCQLLNASVSQTSVQLATAPLPHGWGQPGITLIYDYQSTYLAHTGANTDTQVSTPSCTPTYRGASSAIVVGTSVFHKRCEVKHAILKKLFTFTYIKNKDFFLFQPPEDIHTLKSKQECSHSLLWMVIYRLHKMIQPSNKHTPDFALSVCAKSRWLNPQPNRISSVSVSVHTLNVGGTFLFRRQQSLGKYDSSYTHLCERLLKKSAKCVNSGDSGKIAFLSFVTQAVEMEKKKTQWVLYTILCHISKPRDRWVIFLVFISEILSVFYSCREIK